MRIDVITLFPQMFDAITKYGITGRAIQQQLLQLGRWNPRHFTTDRHQRVDERPYGGGPGMVMMVQPLRDAIAAARQAAANAGTEKGRVIYLSPQGRRFDQPLARQLLEQNKHLVLVSGRYEGVDQRLIDDCIDDELSMGDYILSGGEIAAMAIIDTITRLLPTALGHIDSAAQDSFSDGLLEYPQYTRPEKIEGKADTMAVPEILLSGNHQAIHRWRLKQALGRTWLKRPDLLATTKLDEEQRRLLDEFIQECE